MRYRSRGAAADRTPGSKCCNRPAFHGPSVRSDIVKHRGGLAPWQAKRLAAYIESNISLNLRVADLAGIAQLSISHFSRAFRKSFGQSPLAYVKVQRMRHAQVIMLNTREPLSQVALACGMSDQAHFTRVFRRVVGISPSVWRRQFQSKPMSADDMLRPVAQDGRWRSESAGVRIVAGESLIDDYG